MANVMINQDKSNEKLVDQAKHAVTNVAGQAREQVTHQLDVRKDNAVDKIGDVASALRETGDKLKDIGPLGTVADRAADSIERVADFFENRRVTDLVRDVERFARREPAIFLGATFAIGLIGGRFLKSSSRHEEDYDYDDDDQYAAAYDEDYGTDGDWDDYPQQGLEDPSYLASDELEEDDESAVEPWPSQTASSSSSSTSGSTSAAGAKIEPTPIVNAATSTPSPPTTPTSKVSATATTEKMPVTQGTPGAGGGGDGGTTSGAGGAGRGGSK